MERLTTSVIWLLLALSFVNAKMKLGFYRTPVFKDETVKKYYEEFLKQYEDK